MQTTLSRRNTLLGSGATLVAATGGVPAHAQSQPAAAQPQPSAADIRAIAKEAYIYGYPLVDSYRIQHAYFVDRANPEFKAPYNTLVNVARVYTPDDRAIQTPNSDTPYSSLGLDLRAEPLVLTVPAVPGNRYYSVQLIDAYTFNFDYIGSRTAGNGGGSFLVAGPNWRGDAPPGITRVIRCETELAFGLYRTQLTGPDDIEEVRRIQAGYRVQPLSAFLGQTLRHAGYIEQPAEGQKYSLGVRLLDLAYAFLQSHPLIERVGPYLVELRQACGERVDLSIHDGTDLVYILRMQSKRDRYAPALVGRRLPLYCTAGGKAMLAHMPVAQARSILRASKLEARTPSTPVDVSRIVAELKTIREAGFAFQQEEVRKGAVAVGAAVVDRAGRPLGAIHIAGSLSDWDGEEFRKKMGALIIATAEDVNAY